MSARKRLLPGLTLAAACFALPAAAQGLDGLEPLAAQDLQASRGGQEVTRDVVVGENESTQTAANKVEIGVGGRATKSNGAISAATVTGNHGLTTLMQNTGDGVNMQNATNVNIYLR